MENICVIDPLIVSNLSALVEINENQLLVEQKTMALYILKENIEDFSKKELQSFKKLVLKAYDRNKGENYFFEMILYVIDRQFRKM